MSTVTCSSCGMEYDGTGLQAGVQFQCTQCGSMVVVGAPATAGIKRNAARPRAAGGPPKRGPARAGAGRAAPMAAGQPQEDERPGYGAPPAKKNNAPVIIGVVMGVAVVVVMIVVIVLSGGPDPAEQEAAFREEKKKKQKEDAAAKDAQTKADNELVKKPMDAAIAQAPSIETLLLNQDAKAIENLFDWNVYAGYNQTLIEKTPDFMNTPLIGVGTWEKEGDRYTGRFLGKVGHGPDSLRERVMAYIQAYIFGATELKWDRAKTDAEAGGFTIEVSGKKYIGKKVFIDYRGGGKTKEFWLGAEKGTDNVRLLNFVDLNSLKNLVTDEAKNERTDDRNFMRDPDNRDPSRDPEDEDPEDAPSDSDGDLPKNAKTGAMPTAAACLNAYEDLKRGTKLNAARIKAVETEPKKSEKKATMGAFIDLLIDAVKANDRAGKNRISSALWGIWQPFVPQDWGQDDMVYNIDFDGQSDADTTVRRWIEVYNSYKTE
jgi:DNA-directed RNA polymerase subunit RPC12/RpoP